MRIRYTGDQATEHAGTGVWAPGEARGVEADAGAALVASGAFVEVPAADAVTLAPGTYTTDSLAEAITAAVEPKKKRARKGQEA